MEELIRLLKETNARISFNEKWLVHYEEEFHVLERKYYHRHNTVHYRGESFDEALKALEIE